MKRPSFSPTLDYEHAETPGESASPLSPKGSSSGFLPPSHRPANAPALEDEILFDAPTLFGSSPDAPSPASPPSSAVAWSANPSPPAPPNPPSKPAPLHGPDEKFVPTGEIPPLPALPSPQKLLAPEKSLSKASTRSSDVPSNRVRIRRYQDGSLTTSSGEPIGTLEPSEGAVFELPYRLSDVLIRFGSYDLLEILGEGGMGIVYKAYSLPLCRFCAIKAMKPSEALSEAKILRFQNEAVLAARLRHPNIVPVFDFGENDGAFFFVMEYIRGGSLRDLVLDSSPAAVTRGMRALCKVARALHHAHQRGIVHRDIKPENILLDETDEPYLTDFGIAKDRDQDLHLTAERAAIGTPYYMSPEQASGEAEHIGPKSDLFSLGSTLYHLITGRVPFVGETIFESLVRLLSEEVESPRLIAKQVRAVDLPVDLETVCLKTLEKDASRRYATAEAFAEDLEAFLDDRPIAARPLSREERFQKLLLRNRTAFVGASIVLSVLVLMTLAFGSLLVFNIQRTSDSLRQQDHKAAEDQAKTLIRAIAANMLEGRADIVRSLVQRLRNDPKIASIDVIRTNRSFAYTDLSTRKVVEKRLLALAPSIQALEAKRQKDPKAKLLFSPEEFTALTSGKKDEPPVASLDLLNWIGANFSEIKGRFAQVQTIAFQKIDERVSLNQVRFSGQPAQWNALLRERKTQSYIEKPPKGPPLLTVLMPIRNDPACRVCHGEITPSPSSTPPTKPVKLVKPVKLAKTGSYESYGSYGSYGNEEIHESYNRAEGNHLRGVLVVRRSQKDLEERIQANRIATFTVGAGTTVALIVFLLLFTRLFDIGLRPRRFSLSKP